MVDSEGKTARIPWQGSKRVSFELETSEWNRHKIINYRIKVVTYGEKCDIAIRRPIGIGLQETKESIKTEINIVRKQRKKVILIFFSSACEAHIWPKELDSKYRLMQCILNLIANRFTLYWYPYILI